MVEESVCYCGAIGDDEPCLCLGGEIDV